MWLVWSWLVGLVIFSAMLTKLLADWLLFSRCLVFYSTIVSYTSSLFRRWLVLLISRCLAVLSWKCLVPGGSFFFIVSRWYIVSCLVLYSYSECVRYCYSQRCLVMLFTGWLEFFFTRGLELSFIRCLVLLFTRCLVLLFNMSLVLLFIRWLEESFTRFLV